MFGNGCQEFSAGESVWEARPIHSGVAANQPIVPAKVSHLVKSRLIVLKKNNKQGTITKLSVTRDMSFGVFIGESKRLEDAKLLNVFAR